MPINFGPCRLVSSAILFVAFAQTAHAEMLHCKDAKEVFAGRTTPSAVVHVVIVDPFKDMIVFDDTILGLNVINKAVISAWGQAFGIHGAEDISLKIDRQTGNFVYAIATDEKPQFSKRFEGSCAPAKFEPQF